MEKGDRITWILEDKYGIEIARKEMNKSGLYYLFENPGVFYWFVEIDNLSSNKFFRSKTFSIQLLDSKYQFRKFTNGTIFLEDGLKDF